MNLYKKISNSTTLTNYNNKNQHNLSKKLESLKSDINSSMVVTKLLNRITIKSRNNKVVATIEFDTEAQAFIVTSTGVIPNPSSNSMYFNLILTNFNFTEQILNVALNSNENADKFKSILNNYNFQYNINDKIFLIYKDKTKIEISNYPNIGELYIPNFNTDILQITNNGLINKSLASKIQILNDRNNEVSTIQFFEIYPTFIGVFASSTGDISTNLIENNNIYVQFLNYYFNGVLWNSEIFGKQNSSKFSTDLNFKVAISMGDIARIYTKIPNKIYITNYNNKYKYKIDEEPEFFTFNSSNDLISYTLQYNKIRFKNKDESSILFLYFDHPGLGGICIQPYSTGQFNIDSDFFSFEILDKDYQSRNIKGVIYKNQTGDEIKVGSEIINISKDFYIEDVLELNYSNPCLIEVSDFPDKTQFFTLTSTSQKFKITKNGLSPIMITKLPNTITIKSKNDEVVARIEFDKESQTFIVISTGIIPDSDSDDVYFNLLLIDVYFKNQILNINLNSNEDATKFKALLNNKKFEYNVNHRLFLTYKDKTKIEISNLPNIEELYIPKFNVDILEITNNGLVNKSLNSKIKILNDTSETITTIQFFEVSFPNIGLFAISTNNISTNLIEQDNIYVQLLNYYFRGILWTCEILGKQNSSNFSNNLNFKVVISAGYTARIYSKIPNRIIFTNYNNKNEYIVQEEPEFFTFNRDSELIPYNLRYNKIRFKNKDESNILFIYFDISGPVNLSIQPYSTGKINTDCDFFSFEILDKNYQPRNIKGLLNKNENGDSIKVSSNISNFSNNFQFEDILELKYSDPSLIEVSKFPNKSQSFTLLDNIQRFKIAENGLSPIPINKIPNTITIKSINNEEVAKIEFDKDDQSFIVSSTGILPDPNSNDTYFNLILTDYDFKSQVLNIALKCNENANNFKTLLNNQKFKYKNTDKLFLIYKDKTKIEITNYPTLNKICIPTFNASIFQITDNGLIDKTLNNKILILNDEKLEVSTIQFYETSSSIELFASSTSNISTIQIASNKIYADFLNYHLNGVIWSSKILGKEDSTQFSLDLNFKSQIFLGDILRIYNKIPNRIFITNYNGKSQYKIDEEPEFFTFDENNTLIPFNLHYNKIRFKNQNDSSILFIYFDVLNGTVFIQPYSTGKINKDSNYFSFEILDKYYQPKNIQGVINKNQNADGVIVNSQVINFSKDCVLEDILEVNCSNPSLIEVSKFPNKNQFFNISSTLQRFKITGNGLYPLTLRKLSNSIIIKSKNNGEVAKIEFDRDAQKFIVSSTGIVADSTLNETYFTLALKSQLDNSNILIATLNSNENGNRLETLLNNKNFKYNVNDKLLLTYKDKTKIELTNYPNQGDIYQMKNNIDESFRITDNGIIPYI